MKHAVDHSYHLVSNTFNLLSENIDTDQIIPAQFLTTISRNGLGKLAFYNWRYDDLGNKLSDTVFNKLNTQKTKVLVAGNNFGCGSSREHAPWALLDMGFRAILSTQIADIFRNNAIKNGLLPIVVDKPTFEYLSAHPNSQLSIDIENTQCDIDGYGSINFPLDDFSKYCLSKNYDQLDYLLSKRELIAQFEDSRSAF